MGGWRFKTVLMRDTPLEKDRKATPFSSLFVSGSLRSWLPSIIPAVPLSKSSGTVQCPTRAVVPSSPLSPDSYLVV